MVRFRDGRITYLPVGMLVFVSSLYSVGMWDSHFGAYKKLSMSPHTRYVPMKKTRYQRRRPAHRPARSSRLPRKSRYSRFAHLPHAPDAQT